MYSLIVDCTAFLLHLAVYALDADGEVYQKEYMSAEDLPAFAAANKDIKVKGEGVVGEYYKVTLTKVFTDIKSPEVMANVIYEVE